MQILQTIWTALTTENELLSRIILIPEIFLETIINMLLFTSILNIIYTKTSRKYYVLIVGILGNIFNLFIPNPIRSFINFALIFICIKYFFSTNIIKSILATIIPVFISVLGESLIIKIYMSIFNLEMISITSVPIWRLIIALTIQLFAFIISLLIKYLKVQILSLEQLTNKGKKIFIFNFLLALFTILIQFFITGSYLNRLPIYIVFLSNISLISYSILSIYSLIKTNQYELTALNLEQEKENNRILTNLQDDLRGFRHDFANIMCTIGGFIDSNDIKGLSSYYNGLEKDIIKVNNLSLLNPNIINNPAIFTLIASKYNKALENNIEMNIRVFMDLNILNIKIYEFTRILGILLDNSIEAAKECEEKVINLEIRNNEKRNRQLLIIENTYLNKQINIEQIFGKAYSTKPGNTGLGLWEVRQILKKNKNLNLFTSKNEKYFKQQLEMYNI